MFTYGFNRTYGFRIDRVDNVHAKLTRSGSRSVYIGRVFNDGDAWRNDQCSDRFVTQADAGNSLYRIICGPKTTTTEGK